MAEQLTFDLPARPAQGRDDYFVSPANASVLATVENWRAWPGRKLLITGGRGAGKTHLVRVWAAASGGRVLDAATLAKTDIPALAADGALVAVEDIDAVAEDAAGEKALFHLHNLVLAEGGSLLLSGPETRLRFNLPDLQSRIEGIPQVRLAPPDDALLAAVLVKLFADRQLAVPAPVIAYLAARMERSLEGAGKLVAALDAAALAQKRPVTRALAAAVLDNVSQPGA